MIIPQMEPNFGNEERQALTRYLNQEPAPWLTEFKKTKELEKMIADYVGSKYCTMVCNGTVSIIAALQALNVGRDDTVIVPDYTMFASASAVSILGCKVEFTDIEKDTLCLNYSDFVDNCERLKNVKALILVSINGRYPVQFPEILEYCAENNILVIEDAAQSLGSFHFKKHVGTFGEVGSFSFSTPKIISMGQGGCIVTNSKEIHDKIEMIKNFGRKDPGVDEFTAMGWNFKFTDLQAVIGIEQMKKLPERVVQKRRHYRLYRECLEDKVEFILTNLGMTTPWMHDIIIKNRQKIIEGLKKRGIGTRPFYPAMHTQDPYKTVKPFPYASWAAENGLWLPSSTKLTEENILHVCKELVKLL